jgi:hypothetical protein
MADVLRDGAGKVTVTFEPAFLYEVADKLDYYEHLEWLNSQNKNLPPPTKI